MHKKKIYIISGLGADFKVLEKLQFPEELEVCFLDWKIPEPNESFTDYVKRMAEDIDDSEPFYLLGYSFGGIVVQEIDRFKKAEKVIILGSIKGSHEKSRLMKMGYYTRIPQILPTAAFSEKTTSLYGKVRKLIDPKNPSLLKFFKVRHPYYLKWSIEKISEWKFEEPNSQVIQIMADKDMVFPIANSKPDYIVKGGSHLFPATKHKEVSQLLAKIFADLA